MRDEEIPMLTTESSLRLDSACPLCGASLLVIDREGRVAAEPVSALPLHRNRDAGEGFTVCEQCALLAHLPLGSTLN
jgi:hypothetical protein